MSEQQPPVGAPEYLDSGTGAPLSPRPAGAERPVGRRNRRTAWFVGGVVGTVALGAGAWAAISFFQQGAQPAEALPSTTVAYASIDLDPSGSQKIDAFRTLDKFPALKDKVGFHSVDDVRQKLGDEIIKSLDCDLTFKADIDPWLGNRAAVALVDVDHPNPDPVSVLQVTDDAKARAGLHRLLACGGGSPPDIAYEVHNGWAILASDQDVVDRVVSRTDHASLADDATYQRWTKAVGDSGVVNVYAAPAAGEYLAQHLGDVERGFGAFPLATSVPGVTSGQGAAYRSAPLNPDAGGLDALLHGFKGAAATIRFTGDGLELATATDPGPAMERTVSDQGGAVVQSLPDDTAAALGIGLEPGWLTRLADRFAPSSGTAGGRTLLDRLARKSGLEVPGDIETLFGSSTALSISKDFDYEAASTSSDGSGLPVAVTVEGDPASIDRVLTKLRAKDPSVETASGSDTAGDRVAMGPTPAYRREVLGGGHLGDTDAFRSVIPNAGDAGVVLFVDLDDVGKAMGKLTGGDRQVVDNLAPLKAFGFSGWINGDVARTSLRISTD